VATNRPNPINIDQLRVVLNHSQTFPVKRVEMATGQAKEAYISKEVLLEYAREATAIHAFGGYPKIKAVEKVQISHKDGKYIFCVEFGRLIFL
jgi:hypothetical protein